jgi:branched-chain amino acid transport system permease protein
VRNQAILWGGFVVLLFLLPHIFNSLLAISILNQMAIAIIFALSYNMLLGQGGMLSFGHAVYFGLGGFLSVHLLNYVDYYQWWLPLAIVPLFGGFFGLLAGIFIGSFSTRKAGTVFAMISLGIGELVAVSSIIFVSFFGGEGGISADRTMGPVIFGIDFAQDAEVYYLAAFWVLVATCLMYLFTRTPAGRIANAVRDNPERAEFLGYSARKVRFISFCFSGFFAGIAGGLYALNYEIVTEVNLNAVTSASVLLMAYIGGLGYFIGPIIGAILLTLINTLLINYTDLYLLYIGIMFVLTVMFLPRGFAGLIMMHQIPFRRKTLKGLAAPYAITALPALIFAIAAVALLEMWHAETDVFTYLGVNLNPSALWSWLALIAIAGVAYYLTKLTATQLARAWDAAVGGQA